MSKLSPIVRNGIIIALVVAVVIAAKMFLPTDANSLQVGQCFDPPSAEGEVSGVDDGPCTEPHRAEVFFVGDYTPAQDNYPIDLSFRSFVASTCKPAFNVYTGLDYETQPDLDLAWLNPTSAGWGKGDHRVICYAVRADDAPMSTSIKKA